MGTTFVALVILFAYFGTSNNTIKIGVIATLTEIGQYQGQQEVKGLELAVEEINNSGGILGKQVELIVEDSKADPKEAALAIQKLIEKDNINYIIGDSWTSTTVALVPIINKDEIILISPVAILDSLSENDYFYRTIPKIEYFMEPLVNYTFFDLNVKTVGILSQNTPYGKEHVNDFKLAFEKLGGKITEVEFFELKEKDLKTEILKIKETNPQAVLNLHATTPALGDLIKQAHELGFNPIWLCSFGAENKDLITQYPEFSNGIIYPYSDDANTKGDLFLSNSYDALMILAKAINNTGKDDPKLVKEKLDLSNYFDKNGDVKTEIIIKQIQNGEFVQIK